MIALKSEKLKTVFTAKPPQRDQLHYNVQAVAEQYAAEKHARKIKKGNKSKGRDIIMLRIYAKIVTIQRCFQRMKKYIFRRCPSQLRRWKYRLAIFEIKREWKVLRA